MPYLCLEDRGDAGSTGAPAPPPLPPKFRLQILHECAGAVMTFLPLPQSFYELAILGDLIHEFESNSSRKGRFS